MITVGQKSIQMTGIGSSKYHLMVLRVGIVGAKWQQATLCSYASAPAPMRTIPTSLSSHLSALASSSQACISWAIARVPERHPVSLLESDGLPAGRTRRGACSVRMVRFLNPATTDLSRLRNQFYYLVMISRHLTTVWFPSSIVFSTGVPFIRLSCLSTTRTPRTPIASQPWIKHLPTPLHSLRTPGPRTMNMSKKIMTVPAFMSSEKCTKQVKTREKQRWKTKGHGLERLRTDIL